MKTNMYIKDKKSKPKVAYCTVLKSNVAYCD